MIVSKFGGTSMATAESIQRVATILRADQRRQVCVVSAPGCTATDRKVTDMLIAGESDMVCNRFTLIIEKLGLEREVVRYLYEQCALRGKNPHLPTRLSFGEHMSAYILAKVLRWRFIDAVSVIHFLGNTVIVHAPWEDTPVVMPGFYGFDVASNRIATFPRGGSDITGAYVAAACKAELYENWTDVSGVYDSDPRHTLHAQPFPLLTYADLDSIGKSGAQVFHPDAIHPVAQSGIPIHIRNTFAPENSGTIIMQPSR